MTYRQLEQLLRSQLFESTGTDRSLQVNQYEQEKKPSPLELEKKTYQRRYKKYLDFYDVQRYNENSHADMRIQRSCGDDLSLMTEVVTYKSNFKLFEKPVTNEKFESQPTDGALSQVQEKQSEIESVTVRNGPTIKITENSDDSESPFEQSARMESQPVDVQEDEEIDLDGELLDNQT